LGRSLLNWWSDHANYSHLLIQSRRVCYFSKICRSTEYPVPYKLLTMV
jgi:hypothetical protein